MSFNHLDFKYFDAHCHFFPPEIFKAIWDYFELKDAKGKLQGWPINYKQSTEDLIAILVRNNIEYFTTLNYAHKPGVAEYINDWTFDLVKKYKQAVPFGCVWPEDKNRDEYVRKLFEDYQFKGIKIQPLVQNFYLDDFRLNNIYNLILDHGKWLIVHIGTAPYRNKYVGFEVFERFIEKYPNMNVIVAHMGAFEYRKFLNLLDNYRNLYLDTTMIYIPNNIFRERKTKRPTPDDLLYYQDRILFGSDFPNIPYDYENSTKGLLDFELPRKFYEKIFYFNAKKIFKL
jgi:predicted TIM-barrel fold metal-dependent hydrolase